MASWRKRGSSRYQLSGHVAFSQGSTRGTWRILDVSSSGLCAQGSLVKLDPDMPVDITLTLDGQTIPMQGELRWQRATPMSQAHGWELYGAPPAFDQQLREALGDEPIALPEHVEEITKVRTRFGELLGHG